MPSLSESNIETFAMELFPKQGYSYLSLEQQETERQNTSDVMLRSRFKTAIDNLNPQIPKSAKEQAFREGLNLPHQTLIDNNEAFHRKLTDGAGCGISKKRRYGQREGAFD